MTIIAGIISPRRTKVCCPMNFVSEVIPIWIKIGVAGSVVWTFLLYLISEQGLILVESFYFNPFGLDYEPDDSLPIVIIGCAIIWLLSFLFIRKKPTD